MNWKDVRSTVLTTSQESELATVAAAYYPDAEQRDAEIAEVVSITAGLTDLEKVTAEFWAGGPFTVSPPGMCMWLWKAYMRAFSPANNTFIYSGHDLAVHLFETGRLVWALKKQYMQARPIQEIRRIYRGQTLLKYDGTPVPGESWMPYQETDFVTPPFADFPSGHSAFSQSFANVMTSWFGPSIQNKAPYSYPDLALLSPAFKAAQTLNYGSFVFPAGASLIQPGTVPAAPISLSWPTWQALANSAGLSRKYGGIHATSAHTSSQAVANRLHAILQSHYSVG
jgi:membrane-associated phospholipid phosphatase